MRRLWLVVAVVVFGGGCTPVVHLYGNSLAFEAKEKTARLAARHGVAVESHTLPGTSICDAFVQMRIDAAGSASIAVLGYFPVSLTPCMQKNGLPRTGAALFSRYLHDTRRAVKIFARRNIRIVLVAAPHLPGATIPTQLRDNELLVASEYATASTADGSKHFRDADGVYRKWLPCLARDHRHGCVKRAQVRASDGHLCPTMTVPCTVYASGEWRYAAKLAKPAVRKLGH